MLHGCELSFSYAEATKNRLMETQIFNYWIKRGRRERKSKHPWVQRRKKRKKRNGSRTSSILVGL